MSFILLSQIRRMNNSTAIIGGGAAGLMALSILGHEAFVLEHRNECGRKLLISGGGRCNFTTSDNIETLITRYYDKKNFVSPALYGFPPEKIRSYFASLEVNSIREESGKIFPASGKAIDIVDALQKNEGKIFYGERIRGIRKEDGLFVIDTDKKQHRAKYLIIATGGITFPETGSDGSLNSLITSLGHTIVSQRGVLTEIMCPSLPLFKAEGVSLNMSLKKGKIRMSGEAVITKRGISGPLAENFSHYLEREDEVSLAFLSLRRESFSLFSQKALLKNALPLPERLTEAVIPSLAGKRIAELSNADKDTVIKALAENRTEVRLNERRAMCTRGGVDTAEIDRKSMESKIVENLYFAGEVIDVDGECGGYNITWAFSSAAMAAGSIRKKNNLMLS